MSKFTKFGYRFKDGTYALLQAEGEWSRETLPNLLAKMAEESCEWVTTGDTSVAKGKAVEDSIGEEGQEPEKEWHD